MIKRIVKKTDDTTNNLHWGDRKELGTLLGLTILVSCYKVFGRKLFMIILHPVIAYYTIFSRKSYNASIQYFKQLSKYNNQDKTIGWRQVYKHFYEFGISAIDKIISWTGDFPLTEVRIHNVELFENLMTGKKGALLIGSHLGNIDLFRAIGYKQRERPIINSLVYTKHAEKFHKFINKNTDEMGINLIDISEFGIETSLLIKEKLDNNEIISIVGDRIPVKQRKRTYTIEFLGKEAPIAEGPFVLASVLDCPVYLIFCHKEDGVYNIYLEKFADSMKYPRASRERLLTERAQEYADRLAFYCEKAPYQWFNFYDFWEFNTPVKQHLDQR